MIFFKLLTCISADGNLKIVLHTEKQVLYFCLFRLVFMLWNAGKLLSKLILLIGFQYWITWHLGEKDQFWYRESGLK